MESEQLPRSFIFLGDLLDTRELTKFDLSPNHTLARASEEQTAYIKQYIDNYARLFDFGGNRYELKKVPKKDGANYLLLPKKDWRYWVVETPMPEHRKEFSLALSLCTLELTELFSGAYIGAKTSDGMHIPGMQSNGLVTVNFFTDTILYEAPEKVIRNSDVDEIGNIYRTVLDFKQHQSSFDFISKCMVDYLNVKDISSKSPFKVLSYFAILEHLLTSNENSRYKNSINNQLQKKVNLLNNQLTEPIDFSKFFPGPDTNTLEVIMGKLYQYRNDIAHGNPSNFEKDLLLFKHAKKNIREFLSIIVKRSILFALDKPDLVRDLRAC